MEDKNNNYELPMPQDGLTSSSELVPLAPESVPTPSSSNPVNPIMPLPQAPLPLAGNDDSSTSTQDPGASSIKADDVDLIEKEWVIKAKKIIEETRDNPYAQNKELSKVKASYVKIRFNREVKTAD